MRTFAIGDIHGNYDALLQCIDRSGFDPENDMLISLGDVCDGAYQTRQVIEYLVNLPYFILCRGNHDSSTEGCGDGVEYGWSLGWMKTGIEIPLHWHQGGYNTACAYDFDYRNVPKSHIHLLESAVPFYIDGDMNLYVHGGFDERYPIEDQDPEFIMWDRDLIYKQVLEGAKPIEGYNRVFFGHTSTQALMSNMMYTKPIIRNNCIALDTGGGWHGKLTIMNVDTLEYWQSDAVE